MRTKYLEKYSTDRNSVYIGDDGYFYTTFGPNKLNKKSRRVRSQSGKLYSRFKINGKEVELNIHNEVAKAFIPNPMRCTNVLFKDKNVANVSCNNLYWSNNKSRNNIIKVCKVNTIYKPLDITSLKSKQFLNWAVEKENNTEYKSKIHKELIMVCNCCKERQIIKYTTFKNKRTIKYCTLQKNKITSLRNRFKYMRQRCYNPKNKSYHRYGGRGVTICDEWLNNIESFIDWSLKNDYSEELEIHRIDNDGPYSSKNCKYLTPEEHKKEHLL